MVEIVLHHFNFEGGQVTSGENWKLDEAWACLH